jgi:hypothetical protein
VAREARRPEARLDCVGRRQQKRVRTGEVSVGHDRHRGRPFEQCGNLGRVQQRRVTRHEQRAAEALGQRVPDSNRGGLRLASLLGVPENPDTHIERCGLGDPLGRHDCHRVQSGNATQ